MIAGLVLTKGESREKNAESEGAGGQFYLENPQLEPEDPWFGA